MPFVDESGAVGGQAGGGGLVAIATGTPGGQVVLAPHTVRHAVEETGTRSVVIVPGVAPSLASLPSDAKPGELYMFAVNPANLYVLGSDYVWRALTLVPVV